MIYRFVGTFADLGDNRMLNRFGDSVELTDEEAANAISQRVAIIPDATFQQLSFTPAELQNYGYPEASVPDDHPFHAKRKKAWLAVHELRESLSSKGA